MNWDPLTPRDDDRELVMRRTLRGPRELVWRCFQDAELLRRWWGPDHFTVARVELDFRVGGQWQVTIRSPDGTEFPGAYTFLEIVPPERLVYRNAPARGPEWAGRPPALYTATLTFETTGESETLLTLRFAFARAADKDDSIARGFGRGTGQSLDRLERLLAQPSI